MAPRLEFENGRSIYDNNPMPDPTYRKAEQALDKGKPAEALALCEKVSANSPDALNAAALAVECLAELGRWEDADARAAAVLKEDPEWATGHLIRGLAAIERRKWKDAVEHLESALDHDKTLAEAAVLRATIADFKGDTKAADQWMAAAKKADKSIQGPTRMSAEDLDALLLEVIEDFPKQTMATLDESRFRIVPMPTEADLKTGTALSATSRVEDLDPEGDPPTVSVTFYQRNLEREAGELDDIADAMEADVEAALGALAQAVKKSEGK